MEMSILYLANIHIPTVATSITERRQIRYSFRAEVCKERIKLHDGWARFDTDVDDALPIASYRAKRGAKVKTDDGQCP